MRMSRSPGAFGKLRGIVAAAAVAMLVGLVAIVAGQGLSSNGLVRAVEEIAFGVLFVAVASMAFAFTAVHLANWRGAGGELQSEAEFDELVRHSEEAAREGLVVDPEEADFMRLDPHNDEDFEELVRDALDDLPDLLSNALAHVAVVISDGGRARGAYGLYQGGTVAREDVHDRIVIFRDTLRRDFGRDPDLLREQVTRTVRHELAHHVGFDELGVSRLDL